MGKGEDTASFAAAINAAQQLPDDSGEGAGAELPTMFSFPIPQGESVVDNEPPPDPRRIGGMPKYKLRAHFGRFVIGPIVTMGYGDNETTVDDRDDTPAYEEIQNMCLEGRAVLCWEKPNFLKDGAVVIAMKWMTKHDPSEYKKLYGQPEDPVEDNE
jgi:hypothetical protein